MHSLCLHGTRARAPGRLPWTMIEKKILPVVTVDQFTIHKYSRIDISQKFLIVVKIWKYITVIKFIKHFIDARFYISYWLRDLLLFFTWENALTHPFSPERASAWRTSFSRFFLLKAAWWNTLILRKIIAK